VVQNSSDIDKLQDDSSFEADPTFVDSANGDYSLANSSILIGKGGASYEGVSAPITDLLGLSRPNPSGSNPDIGAYENSLSITPYPAPVKNLTAVGGSGQVTLNWDAVADADSVYKVYKRDGAAFSVDATYFLDTTSSTTYTISGLDNATRYYFRVAAVNKQGYEGTSAAIDITPTYSGPVWWVSTTGSDNNEGSSGSPFKSLGHAIEHVTAGDTVMLKKGTYTGSDNREIEISANKSTTNFDNFKNVVITSEKGADSTIIDAGNNGRHFTIEGNQTNTIDSTLQFIGLTFTGGRSSENGGSFYIATQTYWNNSGRNHAPQMQPKFKDCIFKDNRADGGNNGSLGGAFHISDGAPIFENCVFDSNYAKGTGGAINVGGDNNAIRDTLWFRNCTFKKNLWMMKVLNKAAGPQEVVQSTLILA
jgi:predicted outer membrane repeat protein